MLKLRGKESEMHGGLITVQDNTMLKLCKLFNFKVFCLITVQDNTMLKHTERRLTQLGSLITVQDNTMLKLKLLFRNKSALFNYRSG